MTEHSSAPVIQAWGHRCRVNTGFYPAAPDQPFIELMDTATGLTVCVASVCLPETPISRFAVDGAQPVYIKDWNENAGVAALLEDAGIITLTDQRVQVFFAQVKVAQLRIPVARGGV